MSSNPAGDFISLQKHMVWLNVKSENFKSELLFHETVARFSAFNSLSMQNKESIYLNRNINNKPVSTAFIKMICNISVN